MSLRSKYSLKLIFKVAIYRKSMVMEVHRPYSEKGYCKTEHNKHKGYGVKKQGDRPIRLALLKTYLYLLEPFIL